MTHQPPSFELPVYAVYGLVPANHNTGVTTDSPETLSNELFKHSSQGELSAEEAVLRTAVSVGGDTYRCLQDLGIIDTSTYERGQRMSLYLIIPRITPVGDGEVSTPIVRHYFSEKWDGGNSTTLKHRRSTIVGSGVLSGVRPDQRIPELSTVPQVGWHFDARLVVGSCFKQFSNVALSRKSS